MDQQAIRQTLLDALANLISRSDRIDAHWRAEAPPKDWEELAVHRENDEVIDSLDERTREQIYDIKQAMRRIDAGQWQICEQCGDEIQVARLQAIPTTNLCVKCAQEHENVS
jgi:RNA polymerase-binding transcription factor DksA